MISGRGSNMKALVAAASQPDFPVRFTHVFSDKAEAPGLAWASAEGLETGIVDPKDADDIQRRLVGSGAELVCLAGYMRVLPSVVTDAWTGRMINIHPSLLPKHKGLNAQAKALAAGIKSQARRSIWLRPMWIVVRSLSRVVSIFYQVIRKTRCHGGFYPLNIKFIRALYRAMLLQC